MTKSLLVCYFSHESTFFLSTISALSMTNIHNIFFLKSLFVTKSRIVCYNRETSVKGRRF